MLCLNIIHYNTDKLRNVFILFTVKLLRSSGVRGIDIISIRGHHSVAFALLESIGNFLQSNKLDVDRSFPFLVRTSFNHLLSIFHLNSPRGPHRPKGCAPVLISRKVQSTLVHYHLLPPSLSLPVLLLTSSNTRESTDLAD